VAPFYVQQEGPMPPGGLPRPGKIVANLRNEHLQYAFTWFPRLKTRSGRTQ
jgi:surfeit locus 1 family protein